MITIGSENFRCMSWNLCNQPNMDKDPAYTQAKSGKNGKGLQFKDRLDQIADVIEKLSPDIIGFQEVRDYEGGTVMSDLWRKLGRLGYRFETKSGSSHGLANINVIAYKADKLWPQTVKSWWNSDTPDEVSCSYGNGWPRAVLATEFYPVKQVTVERKKQGSNDTISFVRPSPDYSSPSIVVVNSHLGLANGTSDPRERVFSNQNTVEKIKQFVSQKPTFVVSLGDFNSFPDGEFYEQEMSVYKENGFIDGVTSSPLKNQDGISVNGTFIGYSPDKFKCQDDKFGNSLDHIFYRTFNENSTWNIKIKNCFVSTLTGDPELDSRKIERESDLLRGEDGSSLRDKYPSDHLPAILDFELNRENS